MKIDLDRLIEKVQAEHRVLISKDDPVFVSVTLHRLVMEQFLSEVNEKLETSLAHIAAGTKEQAALQIESSKQVASGIISAAPEYIQAELQKAIKIFAIDMTKDLAQLEQKLRHHVDAVNSGRRSAWLAVVIAAALAGVAIGSFIAGIR